MSAPAGAMPQSFWEAWQEFLASRDLAELETEELEGLLSGACRGRALRERKPRVLRECVQSLVGRRGMPLKPLGTRAQTGALPCGGCVMHSCSC